MTVTVFGYLILISIDFLRFYFSVFSLVLVSIERIYQTLKVRQKYSAAHHIFNSLFGVWKCSQTRSFVFDILLLPLMGPYQIKVHGRSGSAVLISEYFKMFLLQNPTQVMGYHRIK